MPFTSSRAPASLPSMTVWIAEQRRIRAANGKTPLSDAQWEAAYKTLQTRVRAAVEVGFADWASKKK